MHKTKMVLLKLLAIAVLIHIAAVVTVSATVGSMEEYAFRSADSVEYYEIARNIVQSRTFAHGDDAARPDTWRTPGYPLFLAICIRLAGIGPQFPILMQQLLSVLNVVMFSCIMLKYVSPRQALIAGIIFALEPYHIFYSLWLMPTTLFLSGLLASWIIWLRWFESRELKWPVLFGIVVGTLVLVRPIGVLVPVAGAVAAVLSAWTTRRRFGLLTAGMSLALSFLTVVPWMIRNYSQTGHFALSHQSGIVLAYFKAAEVALWRNDETEWRYIETSLDPQQATKRHTVWEGIDEQLRARMPSAGAGLRWQELAAGRVGPGIDAFEVSSTLKAIAWAMLIESPVHTVSCYTWRCVSVVVFPMTLVLSPPEGVSIGTTNILLGLVYTAMLAMALINTVRRRVALTAMASYPLLALGALMITTTPQMDPRFRVPMLPMLILLMILVPRSGDQKEKPREE